MPKLASYDPSTIGQRAFTDGEGAMQFVAGVLDASTEFSIVATDDTGVIQLWNEGARRLYGYAPAEVIGRSESALHTQENQTRRLSETMMRGARERGAWRGTVERRRKDGGTFTARVTLNPRLGADGAVIGFLLISRDVTDEQRMAADGERSQDANVKLQEAGKAKDRFLANMSHELRTPLNAILGLTGTLLMGLPGPLNASQTKQLRIVQSSSRHLLSLINDLLDLARIEAGKLELNIEAIDCRELLTEVTVGLLPLAEAKGIELVVRAPEAGLTVHSDRRALRQILINLANNAIKFTDHGSVELKVVRDTQDAASVTRFEVVDTGCGIEAADQERLFAAFEQIKSTATQPYEGTGLGLYICQTLADFIGATITFASTFGDGSSFLLELPE